MSDIRYNKSIVKNINESLIRKALRGSEVFTKTRIARDTGLSFPTVSRILDEMAQEGEILSNGVDPTTGGRHAHSYTVNPDYAYVLCLYYPGRSLHTLVLNALGQPVEKEKFLAESDRLKEQIDEIVELKMKKYPIRAISAGLPWGINNGTILFGAKSYGLEGYNLQEHLEEKFGVSARVENDMNTIVTGCYNRMFTDEKVSIACVNFGNRGCGCGLYLDGHLVRGTNGFAGELRYLPMNHEANLNAEYEGGFMSHDAVTRIAQTVSSLCATVDPACIVFYKNPIVENILPEVREACSRYLPDEVIPELILTETYQEDFERGLVQFGTDQLLAGYRIINR